jgi:hypothetical protein
MAVRNSLDDANLLSVAIFERRRRRPKTVTVPGLPAIRSGARECFKRA